MTSGLLVFLKLQWLLSCRTYTQPSALSFLTTSLTFTRACPPKRLYRNCFTGLNPRASKERLPACAGKE